MTYKITYEDIETGEIFDILFGDSYKPYKMQRDEYERLFPQEKRIKEMKSKQKWIGWGGLKWCRFKHLQEQLNREGCQSSDPDNPKPRKAEDFLFV